MTLKLIAAALTSTALLVPMAQAQTPPPASPAVTTTLPSGVVPPEGYSAFSDLASLTADQLKGVDLHGPNAADIGDISDVELSDGKVTGIISDIGGFLGMGTHRVKLGLSDVSLFRNADGKMIAMTAMTEEALKALPAYEAP